MTAQTPEPDRDEQPPELVAAVEVVHDEEQEYPEHDGDADQNDGSLIQGGECHGRSRQTHAGAGRTVTRRTSRRFGINVTVVIASSPQVRIQTARAAAITWPLPCDAPVRSWFLQVRSVEKNSNMIFPPPSGASGSSK